MIRIFLFHMKSFITRFSHAIWLEKSCRQFVFKVFYYGIRLIRTIKLNRFLYRFV